MSSINPKKNYRPNGKSHLLVSAGVWWEWRWDWVSGLLVFWSPGDVVGQDGPIVNVIQKKLSKFESQSYPQK